MGVAGGAKQNHSLVRGEHVPPWKDRQKQRERCVSVKWTTLVPRLALFRPGLVCMTPAGGPGGPPSPHCSESLVDEIKYGQGIPSPPSFGRTFYFSSLYRTAGRASWVQEHPNDSLTGTRGKRGSQGKERYPSTSPLTTGCSEARMAQRSDSGLPSRFKLGWECLRSLKGHI